MLSPPRLDPSALGSILFISGTWGNAKTRRSLAHTGLARDQLPEADERWLNSGVLSIPT